MPVKSLPPELWLIILHLVTVSETLVYPYGVCDYLTFPVLLSQLRSPSSFSPVDESYRQLRLVCRAFNHLLSIPSYFAMINSQEVIPPKTVALRILPFDHLSCLKRLVQERSVCRNIVALDIPCPILLSSTTPTCPDFDLLCVSAKLLPNIRSLILGFHGITPQNPITRFWGRLNESFPLLKCLVISAELAEYHLDIVLTADEDPVVTFAHVKILDVSQVNVSSNIHFPCLLAVVFNTCAWDRLGSIVQSGQVESVLIRTSMDGMIIGRALLPHVKLFGYPFSGTVKDLPLNHPLLEHLCVFFISPSQRGVSNAMRNHGSNLIPWLKHKLDYLPALSRITLDLSMASVMEHKMVEETITEHKLASVGLRNSPVNSGDRHIVLERVVLFSLFPLRSMIRWASPSRLLSSYRSNT